MQSKATNERELDSKYLLMNVRIWLNREDGLTYARQQLAAKRFNHDEISAIIRYVRLIDTTKNS